MKRITFIVSMLALIGVFTIFPVYAVIIPVVKKSPPTAVMKKPLVKKVVPAKKVIQPKKKVPAKPVLPVSKKPCAVGGCSGTICGEPGSNKLVTTCEFKPEYACYTQAVCGRERLEGRDRCVWQFNEAFNACIHGLKPVKKAAEVPPSTPTVVAPPAAAPKTIRATISGFAFNPPTIEISKGDTVIWTQLDSVPHTVTSDSGTALQSDALFVNQTYSHTFTEAGSFPYHCNPHPSMKGTVVVK